MLKPEAFKDFSKADVEQQRLIWSVVSRMQVELVEYMLPGLNEPGSAEVHAFAARKVQVYLGSVLRELTAIRP